MSEANVLSLKVLINSKKSTVLFAEANNHTADILLSFLTLPLGRIVQILSHHYGGEAPVFGSLTTLHKGLVNLDTTHFTNAGAKQMLVNPRSSLEAGCRWLKLDISDSNQTGADNNREAGDGVFTVGAASFVISDDLRVLPNVGTLKTLGVTFKDIDEAEMTSLSLGLKHIMDLLKCALTSKTPLTDVFINSGAITTPAPEYEHVVSSDHIEKQADRNMMMLKVFSQHSTGKFLFALAEDDFLDYLLSFLTIPLGRVCSILGGKTGLNSIDNLYKSVLHGIDDSYFKEPNAKDSLINPKLACGYICENPFLPLAHETPPRRGRYVRKPTEYIVRDDLTATPYSLASRISILKDLRVPLCDVQKREFCVRVDEGLSILKACLTSSTALTDAVISPVLEEAEEEEEEEEEEDEE